MADHDHTPNPFPFDSERASPDEPGVEETVVIAETEEDPDPTFTARLADDVDSDTYAFVSVPGADRLELPAEVDSRVASILQGLPYVEVEVS